MTTKRKAVDKVEPPPAKRQVVENQSQLEGAFREDLFSQETTRAFHDAYKSSTPYPHAVVQNLVQESLLRDVRSEISEHIHFTLKETDIYRIHQSGDLANLSHLDSDSLKHLPNLVKLRDALYSPDFRAWVSDVTGAGKVSGSKTDMAVNIYTPGSYLLCHDDVIGSRRVSYILYLTDPDRPWKPEWGGGLRLFPTETRTNKEGEEVKVPLAEHNVNIPPSFSQLSFFAVRPGESYHDVEEVYHRAEGDDSDDGGRIRMAISGWYHIPQEGENGFEQGVEQAQAQRSTLAQLKSGANEFDEPQAAFRHYDESRRVMNSSATKFEIDPGEATDRDDDILTEQDLTFLLHYISPSFLTPDMIDQFSSSFENNSFLQLERFFGEKFSTELKQHLQSPEANSDLEQWPIARPPHKHRYAYLQGNESLHKSNSPIARLLTDLLHSHAFKKWLALVTGFKTRSLIRQNALARRFRRGKDYALASPYPGEQPQLEFTIGITPSSGWERTDPPTNGTAANGHTSNTTDMHITSSSQPECGGEEVYMAGDDDDSASTHSHSKSKSNPLPQVGRAADPAIYKSSADDEDDDGILFTSTPSWNTFNVVLRDKGTLRFVKYVSQAAKGDRWDVKGEIELGEDAFEGEEGNEESDGDGEEDEEGEGDRDGDEDDEEDEDAVEEEEEGDEED
jgi:prolyl 3-hydroxylase /prolyl 3,4-dihydroxylase